MRPQQEQEPLVTTFQLHYLAPKLSCLFFFLSFWNHFEDTNSFSSTIRLSMQYTHTHTHTTLEGQSLQTADWRIGNVAFRITVVTDFTYRSKTSGDIRSCIEHVTQIPDFFSQKIYRIYKKRLSLHLPPLLSIPMTQAMKDLGRFTSVNTFGHSEGKVGVCLQKKAFVKWGTGDNALPGSCDINLPSNAGTLFNSLSAWPFALSR